VHVAAEHFLELSVLASGNVERLVSQLLPQLTDRATQCRYFALSLVFDVLQFLQTQTF
jgi:hypothetical protein